MKNKIEISLDMSEKTFSNRVCDAVIQCKDGFTVDSVLEQLDYPEEDVEELKHYIIFELSSLVKEGYIKNQYVFAGDWAEDKLEKRK